MGYPAHAHFWVNVGMYTQCKVAGLAARFFAALSAARAATGDRPTFLVDCGLAEASELLLRSEFMAIILSFSTGLTDVFSGPPSQKQSYQQ
ncbi:hypothetical protein KFK09_024883 [Dendrobium nobile]|uniref:Uncharacterized protein n=1 Tax=Dendrobium nobile TaxID=94219 RepID=A0A8T3AEZ9_DENNO|nr:hypothetical protein KFK09_024883 [Dendrobium nobile]